MLARRSWLGCGPSCNCHLGNAQDAAIGGEVASTLANFIPIPGIGPLLGTLGSEIGGLFGPSAHYTPGGLLYDTAANDLRQGYFAMMQMVNAVRAAMGLPAAPLIHFVGAGSPFGDAGNIGAEDAPLTGPYLAKLLGNPAYASATSESAVTQLQAQGVFDAAIQAQQAITQHLQFILDGLQSGLFVAHNGQLLPAGVAAAQPDYNAVANGGAAAQAPEPPSSYASVQQAAATATTVNPLAPAPGTVNWPLIAGVAVVGLLGIVIIRRI